MRAEEHRWEKARAQRERRRTLREKRAEKRAERKRAGTTAAAIVAATEERRDAAARVLQSMALRKASRRVEQAADAVQVKCTSEAGPPTEWHCRAVLEAQALLQERFGTGWAQQLEDNIEAGRARWEARREQERQRREAHEVGVAFIAGMREQERWLRQLGLRPPMGKGTGGRQRKRERVRRHKAAAQPQAWAPD